MAKRIASVQLTKDNYEHVEELEGEQPSGPLTIANEETLKTRKILKPRRRLDASSGDGGPTAVLSGFKGFQSTQPSSDSFKAFSFGNAISDKSSTAPAVSLFTFGTTSTTTTTNGNASASSSLFAKPAPPLTTTITPLVELDTEGIFKAKVKSLNDKFYEHITKYVAESKLYNFTNVCEEYVRHFRELQKESDSGEKDIVDSSKPTGDKLNEPKFNFKPFSSSAETTTTTSTISSNTPAKNLFAFGTSSALTFGTSAPPPPAGMFSFGAPSSTSTPFVFKPPAAPALTNASNDQAETGDGEENEVPPKVESVEHKEENAVFTQKCKLYYQKEGQFIEKGVGFLYIKRVDGDENKPQLLIRADTSTGNILLNIGLVNSLPIVKAEKKGVMVTCIPNPPLEVKKMKKEDDEEDKRTTTFLVRVKQSDVDLVYDALNKYKRE